MNWIASVINNYIVKEGEIACRKACNKSVKCRGGIFQLRIHRDAQQKC